MKIRHLYDSVQKKYSLLRAYENNFVRDLDVRGKGLDLGAKSEDAKYYEYLDMSKVKEMKFIDYFHSGPNIIKMDLEKPFPILSDTYDFIFIFNVLEHIYNFQQLLSETYRILSKEGSIHGFVPLMWRYHPDPNDYFRYTIEGLKRVMSASGFLEIHVVPLAAGPFKVAVSSVAPLAKIKLMKFLIYSLGIFFDTLLQRISNGNSTYALAYYFTGVKSRS